MSSLQSTGSGRSNNEALQASTEKEEEEEEDDYMSMTFSEPTKQGAETSIQRRARKQREAEVKSRTLSKAEQAAQDAAKRNVALATSLETSNKGFQMMAKLGFKGGALGKDSTEGRTEPIQLAVKEDRGGIGLDSERKRKFREEAEGTEKKVKAEEGDYRERVRREREEKRLEGQLIGAMKVAERLDAEGDEKAPNQGGSNGVGNISSKSFATDSSAFEMRTIVSKPLFSIPVLWRGLARHRLEAERERRMRYDLHQSLSRLPDYIDLEEDTDDKRALGQEEEELEEEDPELEEFNALESKVKLAKIVEHLREKHWYCFWCKRKYEDADLSGCPGVTEEDHD